ncbi:hypothetical protein EDB81DRAFT_871749 [Dactylonectria macrodidyma]|uniref:DUF7702 domain-containing protein n=1 Tax=Dactylonectria macrodidyma TaxID=307937 RepID=A0A9P9IQT2_9HYPO|nr:hypothetical protein EDB81DRAFT_871749 [Dactylonectria macrodidyma]
MGHVSLTDGLAIWQLIYYVGALCCSLWVSAHHGFMKSSGWVFLTIFSIIRIVSCSAQIATITVHSDTPVTIAVITGFFGLSPLLLATLGIVSRVWYSILKTPWNIIFSLCAVRVVQVPAAIALILCIVGGVSADDPVEIRDQGTVMAGVILYLIVLRRLLCAVVISLPALFIRVIYSLLAVFSKKPVFATMSGSTPAVMTELFMGRIEEMTVVLVYLWAGITQEVVPDHDDGAQRSKREKLFYRAERGDFGTGKLSAASFAAHAVINMLRGSKEDQSAHHSDERIAV